MHLLSQSEAFQGNILPHESSGVWELHFKISRVFPDGTLEEKEETRNIILNKIYFQLLSLKQIIHTLKKYNNLVLVSTIFVLIPFLLIPMCFTQMSYLDK